MFWVILAWQIAFGAQLIHDIRAPYLHGPFVEDGGKMLTGCHWRRSEVTLPDGMPGGFAYPAVLCFNRADRLKGEGK